MVSPASQEAASEGVGAGRREERSRRAAAPQLRPGLAGRGFRDPPGPGPVASVGRSSARRQLGCSRCARRSLRRGSCCWRVFLLGCTQHSQEQTNYRVQRFYPRSSGTAAWLGRHGHPLTASLALPSLMGLRSRGLLSSSTVFWMLLPSPSPPPRCCSPKQSKGLPALCTAPQLPARLEGPSSPGRGLGPHG